MYNFDYLIDKIKKVDFVHKPYKHIYIENFLSQEHFNEVISSNEIVSLVADNDKQLIDGLINRGFLPIEFPGCITDIKKYISWHEGKKNIGHHSATEGFGMCLRLYHFQTKILKDLNKFITSSRFKKALAEKLKINIKDCVSDGGIQKYLDKYEISPHPDVRSKAATFMVNINPSKDSEKLDYHTRYLKFKTSYKYVNEFWRGNNHIDRVWVPWEWTNVIKQQVKNNSIVIFSPSDDTMHGVKCNYNHLNTQRTQLYGNLWYKKNSTSYKLNWEHLDLLLKDPYITDNKKTLRQQIASFLPESVKNKLKNFISNNDVGKRNI